MQHLHWGLAVPIFEYQCRVCEKKVERYSPSLKASADFMRCGDGAAERGERPGCGGMMRKVASVPKVESFKPFSTRNLAPDGSLLNIESKSQLNRYMRQFGVREARVNGMFGGDMRSTPLNPERPGKMAPVRRPEVGHLSMEEAKAIETRAVRTNSGTRRA